MWPQCGDDALGLSGPRSRNVAVSGGLRLSVYKMISLSAHLGRILPSIRMSENGVIVITSTRRMDVFNRVSHFYWK